MFIHLRIDRKNKPKYWNEQTVDDLFVFAGLLYIRREKLNNTVLLLEDKTLNYLFI